MGWWWYFVYRRLISRIHYGDSLSSPGRQISGISPNERKFGIKRGMNVKCFFPHAPSFHPSCRCGDRGDDHLSWHCRDDCLDVHESICRGIPEKLRYIPFSIVLRSDKGLKCRKKNEREREPAAADAWQLLSVIKNGSRINARF